MHGPQIPLENLRVLNPTLRNGHELSVYLEKHLATVRPGSEGPMETVHGHTEDIRSLTSEMTAIRPAPNSEPDTPWYNTLTKT